MESDAFKIPLRPNPSTLPNVFPTILHAQEPGLPNKQKSFSFLSLFKRARVLFDQYACVPGGGQAE